MEEVTAATTGVDIVNRGGLLYIDTEKDVRCVEVYTVGADLVHRQWNKNPISLDSLSGIHVVSVELVDGHTINKKMIF